MIFNEGVIPGRKTKSLGLSQVKWSCLPLARWWKASTPWRETSAASAGDSWSSFSTRGTCCPRKPPHLPPQIGGFSGGCPIKTDPKRADGFLLVKLGVAQESGGGGGGAEKWQGFSLSKRNW